MFAYASAGHFAPAEGAVTFVLFSCHCVSFILWGVETAVLVVVCGGGETAEISIVTLKKNTGDNDAEEGWATKLWFAKKWFVCL